MAAHEVPMSAAQAIRSFCCFVVGAGVLAVSSAPARAQSIDEGFALDRLRPATTSDGILDVEWGGVGEHLQWDVALWSNWGRAPFVLYDGDARVGALVEHRVGADLVAAVALFDWVEIAADLPVLVFQTTDTSTLPSGLGDFTSAAAGLGDLRLAPKIRLLRAAEQLVDLALIPAVTLPTAQPAGLAWTGEGAPTFVPELAVSRSFGAVRVAGNGAYRARFNERTARNLSIGSELVYRAGVGVRLHDLVAVPLEIDASLSGATLAAAPFTSGTEENPVELLGAVRYDLLRLPATVGAGDAFVVQGFVGGGAGLVGGVGTPDFRVLGGLRLFVPDDVDHDDDGIVDATDRCPARAEDEDAFDDADGCPDDDNDQDGLADAGDRCPNEAEDNDGFDDTDGCPDVDNDKDAVRDRDDRCPDVAGPTDNAGCPWPDGDADGVLDKDDACPAVAGVPALGGCPDADNDGVTDAVDRCPTLAGPATPWGGCPDTDKDGLTDNVDKCPAEAETVNNVTDDDGCPDEGKALVALTEARIEILEKVFFDTGKATIQARSFALLDQVATVLRNHAELATVRVEGHTDDKGDDAKNLALSQARADAVRDYLIGKGIEPVRLVATGLGETRPAVPNKDAAAREQNRRVEFVIAPPQP
jgi:outer membrane protein OmpA-like peptidoglycan-associated protein